MLLGAVSLGRVAFGLVPVAAFGLGLALTLVAAGALRTVRALAAL